MQNSPACTVGVSVYQRIKRDIIFGALTPGAKLKLNALKSRYQASLTTLRETLNRLSSEGFVVAEQQRGFFVSPVSKRDLAEITELRVLLECSAVRTSVQCGDTDWEGDLVATYHKLSLMEQQLLRGDESQKEPWKRYDREFHLALIQACDSRNLLDLHGVIYDKYLRYQMLVLTYRGVEAVDEHKAIFDAALARDATAAAQMLERHVRRGLAHTLAAMRDSNAGTAATGQ
jgi:DNA-binding GntR family transcriptional regulator